MIGMYQERLKGHLLGVHTVVSDRMKFDLINNVQYF